MKLSTRIKKYVHPDLIFGTSRWANPEGDATEAQIVLMVDGKRIYKDGGEYATRSLSLADEYHRYLTKDEHCTLLPLNECPVVNSKGEIIMHYTSTTYKEWCNGGASNA